MDSKGKNCGTGNMDMSKRNCKMFRLTEKIKVQDLIKKEKLFVYKIYGRKNNFSAT